MKTSTGTLQIVIQISESLILWGWGVGVEAVNWEFRCPKTDTASIKSNFSPDNVTESVQIPDKCLHL